MMAKLEDRAEDRPTGATTAILSALLGFVLLTAIAMLVAVAGALLFNDEANWGRAAVVVAGAGLAGGGALWGLRRLKPWAAWNEPVAPRMRKANTLILLAIAISAAGVMPVALSTVSVDDPWAFFSNSPIRPVIAVPAIVAWVVVMVLSLQWHLKVDEHEARTYEFGGLAGLYVYTLLVPAWWLAARAGLMPAPDTMVIFAIVMAVWGVGWIWRRSR